METSNSYAIKVVDTTEYTIAPALGNITVSIKKDGETASSVTNAKVGEEYTITLTAEDGYCFNNESVTALNSDYWEAAEGKENLEYSKDYTVVVEDYENISDKKINPIPNGVTATERTKEDTPTTSNVYMNYISSNDEIVGIKFVEGGKYIINDGDAIEYSANHVVSVNEGDIGKTYTIKKAASDNTKLDSDALGIIIKKAPKIPNTVKGEKAESEEENAKGKITGVTNDMEYAVSPDGEEWTGGTGSDVEVEPGTYYVRYKANNTGDTAGFTGEATLIRVGAKDETVIDLRASAVPASQRKDYGTAPDNFIITVANVADELPGSNTAAITLEDANNGFKSLETTTLPAISANSNITITVKPAENLNAGTYSATLKIAYNDGNADDSNNAETSVNFELIIDKVQWTAPTGTLSASSIQAGQITVLPGVTVANGGTPEYGYALDNTKPTATADNPGFTNVPAGEYYVFVRVKEDNNHTASGWLVSSEKVTVAASSTPSNPGGTTPSNPGSGSGSSGGSSSSGSSGGSSGGSTGGTGAAGTTPTPTTPKVTTTSDGTVVSVNKDGAYVDKDGKAAANTLIKESTGAMHVTDSTGHIAKDDVVTTADGRAYVVGAEGNVVVSDIAEIKGNKYVADENGELVTNAFSTIGGEKYYSDAEGLVKTDEFFNAAGKKYYADEDGAVAVKKLVTVDGKKYFATKTGAIATNKIVTTGGKKYFATKTGAIASSKVVTTGGKKYFATKNGTLATNKWVKAGNKKYFCNKKGVITKTKKIKK